MCEAAQQSHEVWLRLRGRVAEKRGTLLASGTFEGSLGWYPDKWREWRQPNADSGISFSLPTWSNIVVYPGQEDDPEIRALRESYPDALFMERFGAIPCPPSTLVFPEFDYGLNVKNIQAEYRWDEYYGGIEVAIDPGYANPYAVVALWHDGHKVYIIDEVYVTNKTGEKVIAECKKRPWWEYVQGGVIDVAGKGHHGGKSQVEIWYELTGLRLRSQFVSIQDGIDRYKTFLSTPNGPRLFYDERCVHGIKEHGQYKYRATKEDRPVSEKPVDRDNHIIKAVTYWLVDNFGFVPRADRSISVWEPRYPRRKVAYVRG